MHSANYANTFILVSPDSKATRGVAPSKAGSVAAIQYRLLKDNPYGLTSDDILFLTHAERAGLAPVDRDEARAAFFAKPKACLRASPLVKQFGWGLHHDDQGRIALYGVETEEYRRLSSQSGTRVIRGLASSRT